MKLTWTLKRAKMKNKARNGISQVVVVVVRLLCIGFCCFFLFFVFFFYVQGLAAWERWRECKGKLNVWSVLCVCGERWSIELKCEKEVHGLLLVLHVGFSFNGEQSGAGPSTPGAWHGDSGAGLAPDIILFFFILFYFILFLYIYIYIYF